MLRFFRGEGVAQALVGAIVVAIIIVFVIQFRAGTGPTAGLERECVVETRSSCVTEKDYLGAYGLVATRGFTPKQARQLELRRLVLHGLAERELLVEEASRLGIAVSDDEVDSELAKGRFRVSVPVANAQVQATLRLLDGIRFVSVSNSSTNAEFDFKIYERQVRNYTNRSPKEFKDMQRREIVAARMRDLIRTRVHVPENEVWSEFERERSKAVARVVELRSAWFSKYALNMTDTEVEQWAKDHQAEVDAGFTAAKAEWKEECPLISEIKVSIPAGSDDADKALLRERINQAEARLKRREAFEQVARDVSDATNADTGGYLGCLTDGYGAGAETLLKALTTLEAERISPVIESPVAFHLVQFHGKLDKADVASVGKLYVARTLARQFAAKALANRFASELIRRAEAGKSLEAATNELVVEFAVARKASNAPAPRVDFKETPAWLDSDRPKMEVTPPFPITGSPISGAAPSEAVAAKVFGLQKPDAVFGSAVMTNDGVAVLQLKEKELVSREDFEKEKGRFIGSVRAAKADESLVNHLVRLKRSAGEKLKLNPRFAEAPKSQEDGPSEPVDG